MPGAAALSPGDVVWSKPALGVTGIATSSDGSAVFATGCVCPSGDPTPPNIDTFAFDASSGETLWDASFDGPDHLRDSGQDIVAGPDGTLVFVTGTSIKTEDPSDSMWSTIAYDATTGMESWAKHYEGPGGYYLTDSPSDIAVSPTGNRVYVTGYVSSADDYGDYATVAYRASTGERVWARTYRGGGRGDDVPGDDISYAIDVSPDGSIVVVTGESLGTDTTTAQDFATIAYDAATGKPIWVKRYGGPAQGYDVANAVVASQDTVYVTGGIQTDPSTGEGKIATVAYRASDGSQLWAKRWGEPSAAAGFAVTVNTAGTRVFVGGTWYYDMVTLSYRSDGTLRWARTLGHGTDWSNQVDSVETAAGRVFITGSGTAVYDAGSGAKSWSNKVGSNALAVNPDGSVVYVGEFTTDSVVTAYAA